MRSGIFTLLSVIALLLVAPSAQAQGFVSPHFGANFGGDTPGSNSINVGGSGGVMVGLVGVEVDYGFAPDFFPPEHESADLHAVGDLSTLMVNVVVGTFASSDVGGGYVSGGVGAIRVMADEPDGLFDPRGTDLGYNIGGGAVGFFNDVMGIRGDVRYFRDLRSEELDSGDVAHHDGAGSVHFGSFGFFRATVGVIVRF